MDHCFWRFVKKRSVIFFKKHFVVSGSAGAHLASLVVSSTLERHNPVSDRESAICGLLS